MINEYERAQQRREIRLSPAKTLTFTDDEVSMLKEAMDDLIATYAMMGWEPELDSAQALSAKLKA